MYGSKDKTYKLIIEKSEKEIHYYIIYLAEGRQSAKIEISETIYQVYKNSDLRQKSQENIFDRHRASGFNGGTASKTSDS